VGLVELGSAPPPLYCGDYRRGARFGLIARIW
jgi:hypothetical protein